MMSLLAIARTKPFSVVHFHRFFCSLSTNPTQIPDPKSSPNFIVDYLISSFGFSPDKAAKVSKTIAHVKSPEKPDSVCHFLKHHGFTDPQIKTIITWHPEILRSSIQNTLDPNFCALREMGLSSRAVTQIVLSDPKALLYRTALPRIKFLKDFLGGSEASLVRACKANRNLAGQGIALKIPYLHSLGLSTHEVGRILFLVPGFITNSLSLMEDKVKRAKELGFQPGPGMFVSCLEAVNAISREALQKKVELFKNFGWSEDDIFSAFRKSPNMLRVSEKSLQLKMNFLLEEVRCDLSYIASHPTILTRSLQKRLRPRHKVLRLLESNGVLWKRLNFCSAILMTDIMFVERFILPHKEEISGLHETYLAACA